ncbi:histidine kinase N-terminal 7TM domain-containing protein [Natrinema halophilum]|uniref:Histidine kinase N-terminal 7TM region domain-containing protein n=1 Tax=Natrinema halophilum TaxID=1699371 RepID=A0A7D5L086_9EURY|nr:histidine kinase N-terminal 7TM domain-containing protein [Natrinema halophilum]
MCTFLFFQQSLYVGVVLSVAAAFRFGLEYTGRERFVHPRIIALLSIEPIVVVALVFSNP